MTNGKQKTGTLKLQRGERVKLVTGGCLSDGGRARWRMGEWMCTGSRIVFCQGGFVVLQIPIEKILSLREDDRPFSFGKKYALRIEFHGVDAREHVAWAIGDGLASCVKMMCADMNQPVTEADMLRVVKKLQPTAERIVWHLWKHVHTNIHELADLLNNYNHSHILKMIREEINEEARNALGYPLIVFEHRRTDPLSGEEILFSWWIAGSGYCDIMVDDYYESFDEGDFYRIVAELRDFAETEVSTALEDEAIVLRRKDTNRIVHEIDLPHEAGDSFEVKGVHNGMMEIIVPKRIDV